MKKLSYIPLLWIFFGICLWIEYSPELQQSYNRAYENWITTQDTIQKANMNWNLTRAELAKMISNYAINILWQQRDVNKVCKFDDVSDNLNSQYDNWITYACQLWLMGSDIEKFRPNDWVTRAEFGTVLSRTLRWAKNEWWSPYYENHLKALKSEWIMNNISSPNSNEIRWYVMLMLMRSSWENIKLSNNDTTDTTMKNTNKTNSWAEPFPYATKEIKQQLAEKIFNENGEIPSDYFETVSYLLMMDRVMKEWFSLFWETIQQQVFWYYVMRLRMIILLNTIDFSSEDKAWLSVWLDDMSELAVKYLDEHPEEGAELFASVIAYEEKFPYNPQKTVERISKMTKQDLAKEFNTTLQELSEWSEESLRQELLGMYWLAEISDDFMEIREKVLQLFKNDLDMLQSGKTREEYIKDKKAENGIADYSFYLQAPKLFPAELIFAEFVLDPEDDDYRYAFRKLFFSNDGALGMRIEDEKPLPYKADMLWYSITENKVYSLEADLPNEEIRKLFFPDTENFDGILLTLAPYGQVVLYAYNDIYETKEKIAIFQAEEYQLSLEDFRSMWAMYEDEWNPSKNWDDYQKKALEAFPQAAENLKENWMPNKDYDFWSGDDTEF